MNSVKWTCREPNAAFVAFAGDRGAGCVVMTRLDASTAIVRRLYVRPDDRGRGFARELVAAVIDFCRKRGYERLALDTERDILPAAYALYDSMGFALCEPYGPVTYDNATFMELYL